MIQKAIEKLGHLLKGGVPEKFDIEKIADPAEREFATLLNQFFSFMSEIHQFIVPLSKGNLDDIGKPSPMNFLASPFKELHANLLHLTWQASQVASGDYSQRVDFMGDFSKAFNSMIISLESNERAIKQKIEELETALFRIKRLEGILPICSSCKKIRMENSDDKDQNNWVQIESYITHRTEALFSHSICPACMKKLYPEYVKYL
jgi:hypothetical protein